MPGKPPRAIGRRGVMRWSALPALRLAAGAMPLAAAACGSRPIDPQPDIPGRATGIDIHCHVFNARDLPIPGFVLHVVVEAFNPVAEAAIGPLVLMVSLMLDNAAPTAAAEIAGLEGGTIQPFVAAAAVAEAAPAATLRERARQAALSMQAQDARARDMARRLRAVATQGRVSAALAPAAANPAATTDFLSGLATLQPGDPVPGLGGGPALAAAARAATPRRTQAQLATAAAEGVVRHASNGSGVFYMAGLLTGDRSALVRRLVTLPAPADRDRVALVAPAMIDFSYWLDDRAWDAGDRNPADPPTDVTPLAEQIAVMRSIAAFNLHGSDERKYAVHPWVSFCPWRQLAEEHRGVAPADQQFTRVQAAVRSQGFLGVKLYPVMGFRPYGNAGAADRADYPGRLQALCPDWDSRLDAVLARLYRWCVEEDVPIMAHCSFSQFPSVPAARRGAPAEWARALAYFGKLRLNLAHCGGVWDLAHPEKEGATWPAQVVALLDDARYPNVYADLADFSAALTCRAAGATGGGREDRSLAQLAKLLGERRAARQRIMYGTDYMFLVLSSGTEGYVAQMGGCLARELEIPPTDLMGLNAARFLGLDDPTSQTRQRLDRFRKDDFLKRWERQVPAATPPR